MQIRYILLLARTKFRIRRARLMIGIVISGLLFGLTAAALTIIANLRIGLQTYLEYGVNNRYLVQATNMQFSYGANSKALIERALEIYERNKKDGVYSEEELAFEYPIEKYADGTTDLKYGTKASEEAASEIARTQNNYGLTDAQKIAEGAGVKAVNHYGASYRANNGGVFTSILDNSKENFAPLVSSSEDVLATDFSRANGIISDSLYELYLFDNVRTSESEIPVLVNENIYQSLNSETMELCYRDADSVAEIIRILEGDDGSALPREACGQTQSGSVEKIKFHIVGVFPSFHYSDNTDSVSGLIKSIADSGLPGNVMIPITKLSEAQKILVEKYYSTEKDSAHYMYDKDFFIYEFETATMAKEFIKKYNCKSAICTSERPFVLSESSNNAILVADIFEKAQLIIGTVTIITVILSATILVSILGRIVADSRKENAIFLAIGYSKCDILQIYVTYTLIYALITAMIASIIGVVIPFIAQALIGERLSASLNSLFHTPISYAVNIGSPTIYVLVVAASVFLVSVICVVATVILKINRKTLRHLRD